MTFTSRFFGIVWLAAWGAVAGISQDPATTQTPPTTQSPAPASAPAPKSKTPANPPAPTGESTAGVSMIQDLLSSLGRFDQEGRPEKQKLGFEIPEQALNEYLAYVLRTRPRPGISALKVTLLSGNQVSSEVEIDFDAVQKWSPEIFPEALRPVLSGKRTIQTSAQFESSNGSWSFTLKDTMGPDGKAMVGKVVSSLMQALGSRQPESIDPGKPSPLPFGLKRVWTEKQLLCGET